MFDMFIYHFFTNILAQNSFEKNIFFQLTL